jgi:hypothetical protein
MYVPTSADVGRRIRSRVIATNADGTDSFNSNATPVIRAAPNKPSNAQLPTISGSPIENQTLTATTGSWTARLKVGGRGSQPFMTRARKSGERLIGRRLHP